MPRTFKQIPISKILIVSATELEIKPFLNTLDNLFAPSPNLYTGRINTISVDVLITGVGMLPMTYHLTSCLQNNAYDLLINSGIGGCFDMHKPLGTIFHIKQDIIAELGIESNKGFTPAYKDSELSTLNIQQVWHEILPFEIAVLKKLDSGKGLTVNTITGTTEKAHQLQLIYNNPTIESMEGAAFMYVCNKFNVPHLQIRAASNYVAERDKNKWYIDKSINNLKETIISIIGCFKKNV